MSDQAKRFRERAMHCRALSKTAKDEVDAALLNEMESELDAEAARIEAEEAALARPKDA